MLSSMYTGMTCFLPCRSFSSCPCQFCCAVKPRNHRPIPDRNLVVVYKQVLPHCTKLLCKPVSLPVRDRHRPFSCSTIKNALPNGRAIKYSASCSIWTEGLMHMRSLATACVQVHLQPFEPLRTAHCTKIKTSQRMWACEFVTGSFPTFMPAFQAPVIIPMHLDSSQSPLKEALSV